MAKSNVHQFVTYDTPDPDWEILRNRILDQPEKFWSEVSRDRKGRGAISDRHGHAKDIHFPIHPTMYNLISKFRDTYREFYDSDAKTFRSLLYLGIKFSIALLPENSKSATNFEKSLFRLREILTPINAGIEEIEQLQRKKNKILESLVLSDEQKSTKVSEINEFIKQIQDELNNE